MRSIGVVALTVFLAWMLALLPLPPWAASLRPEWTLLVIAYWAMAIPQRFSIGWCWVAGLGLDVLLGTLLGQHALGLTLVGWAIARLHLQIRVYPALQQALVILAMTLMYEFVVFWTDGISGQQASVRWAPALTTAVLWPFLFELLRGVRRRFRVA